MFNNKTFNISELKKENNYIISNYFSDLKITANREDDSYIEYDAILNNIPYTMYKSNKMDFNLLLIPKNFKTFENDFDSIIKYSGNEFGLHLSILNKKNNILDLINYDFITNNLGYVTANYRHDNAEDYNNQLQKEFNNKKCTLYKFITGFNFNQIFNNEYRINRIKRNSKETKLNRIYGTNLLDAYLCFDRYFEDINDNETPLLQLLENLQKSKSK